VRDRRRETAWAIVTACIVVATLWMLLLLVKAR
jgi:hypothetical protein